ncbi:MAG: tRNA 2-thiouridine(34) synthase MnmA [Oscillospiraceae bacterium]|nr:tRNA 2-thiouridine(34) synthase MnmA [Oscillospiraceae bacterium]
MAKSALIAMSGGVDSSTAALLMQQQGYSCVGATMKLFRTGDIVCERTCGAPDDAADAAAVAARLGMEHHVFDFSEQFREHVMTQFVQTYENAGTPNPCIECNRFLKFGCMIEKMHELGLEHVVTGHYARVEYDEKYGCFALKKAVDAAKDQTYFLYTLTPEQLQYVRFPLGALEKAEVRRIAEKNGFVTAKKKESQDICFVPDGDYAGFIERFSGKSFPEGDFTDMQGNVLGTHKGLIHYTIGQRKGLGVAVGHPVYVCRINAENNTVTLGENEDLYTDSVTARRVNLITDLREPVRVLAKIRYRHKEQPAAAWQDADGLLHVQFDEPQRAVTKGQAVVLYDGDTVIGGGEIL